MEVLYERFRAADDPMSLLKDTFAERQQILWREKALDLQSYVRSIKLDLNSTLDVGWTIVLISVQLRFPQFWFSLFRSKRKVLIISLSQVDAEFSLWVPRGTLCIIDGDCCELVDDILRKAEGVLSSLHDKGQLIFMRNCNCLTVFYRLVFRRGYKVVLLTGDKSEKALRLLPYLMPARRLVGKRKLSDIVFGAMQIVLHWRDNSEWFTFLRAYFQLCSFAYLFRILMVFTIERKSGRLGQIWGISGNKSFYLLIFFFGSTFG